jgi:hypothetical protein
MAKTLKFLVIHCTASRAGKDLNAEDIRRMHLSPPPAGRGWKQVGYSDMILLNGLVVKLVMNNDDDKVDPWEITNGVAGMNSICRHIVYVGGLDHTGKPADTRTPEQHKALTAFVKKIIGRTPSILVAGHYHFAAKACPSFNVEKWCRQIGIPERNIYRK